jgi:hypothetical protein
MAGRKTKYTPERATKIIQGLKTGLTKRAASSLGGIDEDTLLRWGKRYADFAAQIRQAEDDAESRYTQVIAKAAFGHEVTVRREITRPIVIKTVDAQGKKQEHIEEITEVIIETRREYDWQAARYWLGKRRRQDWGEKIELSGEGGSPIPISGVLVVPGMVTENEWTQQRSNKGI